MQSSTRSSLIGGGLLILLGLVFLAGQVLQVSVWNFTWPFIVIGVGGLFFVAMLLGGKALGALAIPGSIITGIGLILLVQNTFQVWESWSYSWTLIVLFVGIGIFLYGAWSNLPEARASGLRVMKVGFILFLIFGVFFGLLFTLTGVYGLSNGIVWAVLLIVLGFYLLVARLIRWFRRTEEAGEHPVKFFWPVVFIGVGLLWLLVAMNILPAEQARALFNLWPILLIVGGIDLIIGRRFPVINLLLGLLTVAILFFFAFAGPAFGLNQVSLLNFGYINLDNGLPTQMITGSGKTAIEGREINGFSKVQIKSFGEAEITQGDNVGVYIEADDNLLPYITTSVFMDQLVIDVKPGVSFNPKSTVRYKITVKDLEEVSSSGAALVRILDLKTDKLDLNSSGAGEFQLDALHANKLTVDISGAGSFEADGESKELDVQISGAGSFNAPDLKTEKANIQISGMGAATVWTTAELTTDISGAGSISYYGSPSLDQSNSGAGVTRRLGDK